MRREVLDLLTTLPNPIVVLMPQQKIHSAAPLIPAQATLETLREAATHCQACPLWQSGTQTVFGEGNRRAAALFVGEQPGDQEDRVGKPFVGPAGQLFDRALRAAEIERTQLYVTNVVKHFKWIAKGASTPSPKSQQRGSDGMSTVAGGRNRCYSTPSYCLPRSGSRAGIVGRNISCDSSTGRISFLSFSTLGPRYSTSLGYFAYARRESARGCVSLLHC